jgi:phytoene synthase
LISTPELQAQAAEVTAAGSKSFYFATRFFPPELARAAHAVYWFCRHTDDLVDEAPSVAAGQQALDAWRTQVRAALDEGTAEHPVLRAFLPVARNYGIPAEYPDELLEGMQMDLERFTYPDFSTLRVFCYRVASVVGLMMSHVIGFEGEPEPYAIDLGIAMQLTNILRDVGEDLDRGHIYLPLDELARFDYSPEDLRARVRDERFRRLMRFQVARARDYYERAQPGVAMLNADGRFAVQIASDVYGAILAKIERSDFDVFDRRAVVSARRKYWITARRLTGPFLRQIWYRTGGRQAGGKRGLA